MGGMGYSFDTPLFDAQLQLSFPFTLISPAETDPIVQRHMGAAHQPTCIGDLPNYEYAVGPDVLTRTVVTEFERAPDLPGVLIMQSGRYLGLLSRQRCLQHLSRPFGVEVFLKRSIMQPVCGLGP